MSEPQKAVIIEDKNKQDAIFDNGATTTEMRFLAKMYLSVRNENYKTAFEKGLRFILKAHYENGGWPMFYPQKKGYYTHITFNDDATSRLMRLLRDIYNGETLYAFVNSNELISGAKKAWERGLTCILKTQIVVNGQPTV